MRIGQIAKVTHVPVKTLRYYEEIGVLSPPARTPEGYRDYPDEAIAQINFVKASQSAGLSLKEIREILAYRRAGVVPCQHVLTLLNGRALEYQEKIAKLNEALATLRELIARAEQLNVDDCPPGNVCHLIPTALAQTEATKHRERTARSRLIHTMVSQ
ncbi:MAG: MerR family transcriptional regulator [Ferrimicrobium sp.]|jgi:DNA-binding transcriptional MerR regulator|nr:MerR family transcriptional regulator [Ferrimicrobium sp.]